MKRSRNLLGRRKGLVFPFIALALAGMALAGWQAKAASEDETNDHFKTLGIHKIKNRPKAPPFALPDTKGNTAQLSDFRGKVVLLNFFATWCSPCRWEMPELEHLYQEYKEKGFTVVAISIDKSRRVIPPFMKKMKLTFPILHDPDLKIARRFGFRGPPLTYLIDAEGKVIGGAAGPREWNNKAARQLIEALISGRSG